MNKKNYYLAIFIVSLQLTGCGAYNQTLTFPPAEEIFLTSGDGDIQKPYTPLGQFIYSKRGWRIGLPLLGYIPIADIDPEKVLRESISQGIKEKGGDGLINMRITFKSPSPGYLGVNAKGGEIFVTGTIIKR